MKAEKLQKQLRDEKRAMVYVFFVDWDSYGYRLLIPNKEYLNHVHNIARFSTWEAALEAGVREALNHTK